MDLDRTTFTDCIHPFMGLALHVDALRLGVEESCQCVGDRFLVRAQFRLLADHGAIQVAQHEVGLSHPLHRLFQKAG